MPKELTTDNYGILLDFKFQDIFSLKRQLQLTIKRKHSPVGCQNFLYPVKSKAEWID